MKQRSSWKEKFRYAMDCTFSKGPGILIAWLGVFSLAIILLSGFVIAVFKIPISDTNQPVSFIEAAWESLMRTLDSDPVGVDSTWAYRLVILFVTLGGVFIISILVSILTSGLQSKLENLRKGRSRVLEMNQTVILGWTEQIFTILSELVDANENQPQSSIVIMADKDKVKMEDEIHERIKSTGRTRIVCRTGNPLEINDLNIVSLNTSKSILILSQADSDAADAEVIKTILAIVNYPYHRDTPFHITAELRKAENCSVAKMVGKDELEIIQTGDIIARIIAQTCRQSGLSVIYTDLMDFKGDEIYTPVVPSLVGKIYGETLNAFNKNCVLGIIKHGAKAILNPPMDTMIQAGDQLITLAADDDQIFLDGKAIIQENLITKPQETRSQPEKTIVLGWNWRGWRAVHELDHYVAPGSELMIVANCPELQMKIPALQTELTNQAVSFIMGNTTNRQLLDSLCLQDYAHIIVLCYCDELDAQKADAKTLITLLHLRDIEQKSGKTFSIVSEMMDIRNRNLAEVSQADDFIVSNKLISLLLTQVSENKILSSVFTDLFDPEGSEAYICPITDFVQTGTAVNFYTVVESARRQGKTAIGYRLMHQAHQADAAYGVALNPNKAQMVTFTQEDKVILLAEE
jgi:voltage-gated potassium channel Kch